MGIQQQSAKLFLDKIQTDYPDFELMSPRRVIKRKEFLVRSGQVDLHYYFVESGSLRVYHETAEEDITIRFGYAGSMLAVFPTLYTDEPTPYFIQAIKESVVHPIHRDKSDELTNKDKGLQKIWVESLKHLVLDQLEREIDLLTKKPEDRFERVWKRSPRLFQEIPDKYIANYLRMTPETLSRIKKSFFQRKP